MSKNDTMYLGYKTAKTIKALERIANELQKQNENTAALVDEMRKQRELFEAILRQPSAVKDYQNEPTEGAGNKLQQ